jgi:hypothetical protein
MNQRHEKLIMAKRGILSALSGGMRQNSVYASRDFCCPGGTKTLESLEKKLEHYAIRGRILEITRMPRNENDKLDRKAVAAWLESQLQSD